MDEVPTDTSAQHLPHWQRAFLQRHQLATGYLTTARRYFDPLAERLARQHAGAAQSCVVGLNGSQGSGKSTLADYLVCYLIEECGLSALALSLDDFYLTRSERASLARDVLPLFATRGVPGTHAVALLLDCLGDLVASTTVAVPRFAKEQDDRVPRSEFTPVEGAVDVIILEGWCLGARGDRDEDLAVAVNDLEREEDADGAWRRYADACLKSTYVELYDRLDFWVMLQAPGFEQVLRWRSEQEEKLRSRVRGQGVALMDDAALRRFVAHYERHTRQCLRDLPDQVDVLYRLDENRRIVASRGLDLGASLAHDQSSGSGLNQDQG